MLTKSISIHTCVFEIIERRWNIQLHHPLHVVVHFSNAEFNDNPQMQFDSEVIRELCTCINKLVGYLGGAEDHVEVAQY